MSRNEKDQVSINIFEQIDTICGEFRTKWKTGTKPSISDFLNRVDENAQSNLFRNLLTVEVKLRRRSGELPSSTDYLSRFPQFAKIIRQEFDESTMGSMEINVGTPQESAGSASEAISDVSHTRTYDEPAASRLGDYELLRELGRGGFGVVYEARHIKHRNKVALKTLPTGTDGQEINAERLHKFRKEFRTLSEINHPNLVGMQTLEFDGNQWFFTMDLIKGSDFLSYVRPKDWMDEKHLRSSIKQLAAGIMALHEKGIVHRDLKPSNVLIEPNGRVVILDFGLVAQLQQNKDLTATRSAMFAGTPRYAAPEQMFGQRSEASDWYAMGVMLYEALTGAPPFPGRNPMEVLRQKQEEDPPSIADQQGIPGDLAQFADALIKRDPTERPSTNQIAEELQLDQESTKQQSKGSTDDEELDLEEFAEEEIELIGREQQLAQLESIQRQFLDNRKPSVVWITGKSGEGKSSLVEKFLRPLRKSRDVLVLSGRCYDRESVPFKVIDSQIDPLARYLRSLPHDRLERLLPNGIGMLAHLFPLLRRVESIADLSDQNLVGLDDKQIRNLAFNAFAELLTNIGQIVPVIMFVDDLQWGDADSAEVLLNILSPPSPLPVLFLGSYRSDEMDDSPFLDQWKSNSSNSSDPHHINVEPLNKSQCLEFLQKRLGTFDDLTQQSLNELFDITLGNPYFLEQLLESYDAQSGAFKTIPLEEIIKKRLSRCPSEARSLLEVIAVAGKAVAVGEISEVAGQLEPARATITHMRNEKLVRLIGDSNDQRIDTYHDKIRETTLDSLGEAARRNLHAKYGDVLSAQRELDTPDSENENVPISKNRLFDLAHHYLEADHAKAFEYQLLAGEAAIEAYAIENAMVYLRHAQKLKPAALDRTTDYRLHFSFAEALAGTQDLADSEPYYRRALELTDDDFETARCHFGLALMFMRSGNPLESKNRLDEALNLLGERQPVSLLAKLYCISINSARIVLWPFESKQKISNKKEERKEVLISKSYAIYRNVSVIDILAFVYTGMRAVVSCRSWGNVEAKAIAYSNFSLQMALSGGVPFAKRYAKKTENILDQGCSEYTKALSNSQLCAHYMVRGELDHSEQLAVDALDILKKERDYNHYFVIHWLRHVYSVRGDAKGIYHWASKEVQLGESTKDRIVIAYGSYGLADAYTRSGNLEQASLAADRAIQNLNDYNSYFIVVAYQEKIRALVQASKFAEAKQLAIETIRFMWKEWALFELCLDTYPLYVEALCTDQWFKGPQAFDRKSRTLISRNAARSRWVGVFFPNLNVHALRVSGRACVANGKTKKALKYFDKTIAAAEKIGARYEHARALIDKSMLDHPDAMADRERGLEILKELECVLPLAEQEYLGIEMPPYELDEDFDLDAETNV